MSTKKRTGRNSNVNRNDKKLSEMRFKNREKRLTALSGKKENRDKKLVRKGVKMIGLGMRKPMNTMIDWSRNRRLISKLKGCQGVYTELRSVTKRMREAEDKLQHISNLVEEATGRSTIRISNNMNAQQIQNAQRELQEARKTINVHLTNLQRLDKEIKKSQSTIGPAIKQYITLKQRSTSMRNKADKCNQYVNINRNSLSTKRQATMNTLRSQVRNNRNRNSQSNRSNFQGNRLSG